MSANRRVPANRISDGCAGLTQPGTSTRAPLPASTGDAPLAPDSSNPGEGKGLFTVLGGLGAAAVGAASAVVHRVQEGDSPGKPCLGHLPHVSALLTHRCSVAAVKSTTAAEKGAPAAALDPIASNAATSKITHELAQVDLKRTKDEVVQGIEKIGGVLAGGLVGLGGLIDGNEGRLGDSDPPVVNPAAAKQGSALSTAAFGTGATHTPASADAQRTFASTGGPTASASLGSAATAPAVGSGALPTHQPVNPTPVGTINNIAGAVGSSATTRDSPATATAAVSASSSSPVPGLAINRTAPATGASTLTSTAQVPGLAINGSSSTAPTSVAPATSAAPAAASSTSTAADKSTKKESIADKLKSGLGAGKKDDTAGGSGTSALVGKTTDASAAGRAIGEDKPSVQAGQAEPATSGLAATPASTVSKKDTSALGRGQPSASPVTPKKGGHGAEASSATPASDGYKTAPSTPATPADRKRKSSM